jgi:hypothetical protein
VENSAPRRRSYFDRRMGLGFGNWNKVADRKALRRRRVRAFVALASEPDALSPDQKTEQEQTRRQSGHYSQHECMKVCHRRPPTTSTLQRKTPVPAPSTGIFLLRFVTNVAALKVDWQSAMTTGIGRHAEPKRFGSSPVSA